MSYDLSWTSSRSVTWMTSSFTAATSRNTSYTYDRYSKPFSRHDSTSNPRNANSTSLRSISWDTPSLLRAQKWTSPKYKPYSNGHNQRQSRRYKPSLDLRTSTDASFRDTQQLRHPLRP